MVSNVLSASPAGASFAENFYDLKRVPSGDSAGEKLSKTLQWRSILNLVSCLSTLKDVQMTISDVLSHL